MRGADVAIGAVLGGLHFQRFAGARDRSRLGSRGSEPETLKSLRTDRGAIETVSPICRPRTHAHSFDR
jgi:hypothetical protein